MRLKWNYRVARQVTLDAFGDEQVSFVLVEAYYDHDQEPWDRPDAITVDCAYPYGVSVEALKEDYDRMLAAFGFAVLDRADYQVESEKSDAATLIRRR